MSYDDPVQKEITRIWEKRRAAELREEQEAQWAEREQARSAALEADSTPAPPLNPFSAMLLGCLALCVFGCILSLFVGAIQARQERKNGTWYRDYPQQQVPAQRPPAGRSR